MKKILKLSFLSLLIFSCSNQEDYISNHHHSEKIENEITFQQFLNETNVNDFSVRLNLNPASNALQRTASLNDFVIDTVAILKHISQNNKATYSFKVEPLNTLEYPEANSYNIIYHKISNSWEKTLISFDEIENPINNELSFDNFDNLYSESPIMARVCMTIIALPNCNNQCVGTCDRCHACTLYVAVETGCGGGSDGGIDDVTLPDLGSSGSTGGSGAILEFEPNPKGGNSNLVDSLATNFFNYLSLQQQQWANSNQNSYNQILNYLRNENWSDESEAFAQELIDLEINGNLLSFFPTFKYPAGSNYSTLYPNFTILIKEYIPLLKNDQRLLNTINRLTGVSISTIKQDLTWGNGPEINITQLGLDPSGNPYYGKFNILEPNKIYIDIDLVQQIEALSNIPNPTPQQNQQIGFLNALITFSVCLHEYVHYSDFAFDGTMQDNENLELGLLFEEIYLGGYYEFNPNGNVIFIKAN